jgi:predicted ATPase
VKSTRPPEAKRSFETAIELAERQSSKSFLLRAAMSLHRLSKATKEQKRSRELLERVYGSFTEGFGTGDLRDARRLLT